MKWREEKEWDAMFNQIQMEQKKLDQMEVSLKQISRGHPRNKGHNK